MNSERHQGVLSLRELRLGRGGKPLCSVPSLMLGPGQGVWVRGPNGAGKTTLLRTVAGLCPAVAGECWRLPELPVVYLGHRNGLKDELTVLESAQLMHGLRGVPLRASRLESALSAWGLWGRRHQLVRALSQGLRRRVALLRLELSSPDALWLLDEPADALDALGTSLLRKRLVRHREQGGAWLITSHVALFEPGDPDVPELHLGAEPPACG